jgi:hypothetical protein
MVLFVYVLAFIFEKNARRVMVITGVILRKSQG